MDIGSTCINGWTRLSLAEKILTSADKADSTFIGSLTFSKGIVDVFEDTLLGIYYSHIIDKNPSTHQIRQRFAPFHFYFFYASQLWRQPNPDFELQRCAPTENYPYQGRNVRNSDRDIETQHRVKYSVCSITASMGSNTARASSCVKTMTLMLNAYVAQFHGRDGFTRSLNRSGIHYTD